MSLFRQIINLNRFISVNYSSEEELVKSSARNDLLSFLIVAVCLFIIM